MSGEFRFGIDQLISGAASSLKHQRLGLVAHPASVTAAGEHSLDALMAGGYQVIRAFGPQHGLRGDKQDNMVESEDYIDAKHGIPITSLYGSFRYPQPEMLQGLDAVLFDLQDIGCRVYTYITTLRYFIEACAAAQVRLVVLDRPNPAGRPIDGTFLEDGQQSFVGSDLLPMRHGLTVGELALWFSDSLGCASPDVITMAGYNINEPPGFGWPVMRQPWINPSPNASSLNMSRCFAGTVLLEGTTLSEGRGTTTPLEVIGAPDLPVEELLAGLPAAVADGVRLRPCSFLPTFHKHVDTLCHGLQLHTDCSDYNPQAFRPYLLIASILKTLRLLRPEYPLWRYHEYEYETGRTPIDVINGGTQLRQWVDDLSADQAQMVAAVELARSQWTVSRDAYLRY